MKWIGILFLILVVVVAIAFFTLTSKAESRLEARFDIEPRSLAIPTHSASIALGEHWVKVLCTDCHSNQLEGMLFFNEPDLAVVWSPNLTSGKGGIGNDYGDKDWLRAIMHGVAKDGRPIFIMPSIDLHNMSGVQAASMVAYLKTMPAVDNETGTNEYGSMGKLLLQFGAFGDVLTAESIDHKSDYAPEPNKDPSAEYGEYLMNMVGCRTCHGQELNGGQPGDPNSPFAPNITSGGAIGDWTFDQFKHVFTHGITPAGRTLDPKTMPWKGIGNMSDDELTALYKYLLSK